jgi:hypothetical protein
VSGSHFSRSLNHVASLLIADQGDIAVDGNTFRGFSESEISIANAVETGLNGAGAMNRNFGFTNNTLIGIGADVGSFHGVTMVGNRVYVGRLGVNTGTGQPTEDAVIASNTLLGGGVAGSAIACSGAMRPLITGNVIREGGTVGLYVNGCADPEVAHNVVSFCQRDGVRIATCTGVRALCNRSFNNGQDGSPDNYGMLLDGAGVKAVVTGNQFTDTQAVRTQRYGLGVNGGSVFVLADNVSDGNIQSPYREITAPTYAIKARNLWNGVIFP